MNTNNNLNYFSEIDKLIVQFAGDLSTNKIESFRYDFYTVLVKRLISRKFKSFTSEEAQLLNNALNNITNNVQNLDDSLEKIINTLFKKNDFQSELAQVVAGIFNDLAK